MYEDINEIIKLLEIIKFDFKKYYSYFDQGIVKLKSKTCFEKDRIKYGNDIGPSDGTYVFPKKLADFVIKYSDKNPRKLERLLSLETGALGDVPILIDVKEEYIVRIPTGKEKGANRHWQPGGYTKEGIPEAVVDSIKDGHYVVYPVFG